jgi:protein involved in polysaccharide export with SLBB domain
MKSISGQLRSPLRATLIFVLLASSAAFAQFPDQNQAGDQTTASNSISSQNSPPPELSADDIITVLQQNPDVVSSMKAQAAQNGITGTKEQFIQRIQTDEQARIQITQYLIDQRVVDPKDPRLHTNGGTQANQQNGSTGAQGQQIYPANSQSRGSYGSNQQQGYGYGPNQQQMGQYPSPQNGSTQPNNTTTSQKNQEQSPDQIPVQQLHLPSAYQNIPALKDLYSQVKDFNTHLDRFGVDILQSNSSANVPPDVSAGPDYILGPGDELVLVMWGGLSREMRLAVDRDGRLALPEIGTIMVSGKTLGETRDSIQKALSTQYRAVHSDLSLARVRTVRAYVVGDVVRPGAYDISALSTVLNAVAAAGGPTDRGSLRRIKHYRGDELVAEVDMYDLLLKGVRGKIAGLAPGDTILVPPVGPQVSITGMVRRPAIYELKNETDLSQVLELAGGVLATGSLREVRVERVQAHQQKEMLSLKLPDSKDKAALQAALAGFRPQDGDRIIIGAIAPYSNQAVYLDGHVIHPGKYSFHDGMDVSELIRSYRDLMPEPSNHAEIIRLKPPDMRPEVIDFNLSEVLGGEDPVTLQPFDTIRIYGRYDIDAPMVAIYGEVSRPGEYPMGEGMTAVDLVRMAGGLKRSAYTVTADLASYTVDQNRKVEVESRSVEIGKALRGAEDTDVRLKPRDVLTIRQLAGWNTVGTVVSVSGEVNYPGTYGIVEGEKLSSVLKRAGGFREDAYPHGAILNRDDVRKINEHARDTLITRVQTMIPDIKDPTTAAGAVSSAEMQSEQIVKRLQAAPVSSRQVIRISGDISKWANTPEDIELRPGDEIVIPKYPTFVAVQGQVNSPSAITYIPGKKAEWYFKHAGGHTAAADMKNAFIIRADGSVLGKGSSSGFWSGNVMSTVMYQGDTIVVPEKIVTGSNAWRGLLQTMQVMSQVAITAGVVANF